MARDDGVDSTRPLRRPPTMRIDHGLRGGGRGPPRPFRRAFAWRAGAAPGERSGRAAVRASGARRRGRRLRRPVAVTRACRGSVAA